MADYAGADFLRFDEMLSDEECAARDTVREFVSKEFLPILQQHIRQDGSFPLELVPKLGELVRGGETAAPPPAPSATLPGPQ